MEPPRPGRRRAQGTRTRQAILDAAMRLASISGVNGLTIGQLAAETGVSKSGLFAHFGSKLELQLQTIEAATAVIRREVMEPGLQAKPGIARLLALCEAYLSYVERRVFPGGCLFAGLAADADGVEGPVRDVTATIIGDWLGLLARSAREAQELGEMPNDLDADQLAFELHALLEQANYLFILFDDPQPLARARTAIERITTEVAART